MVAGRLRDSLARRFGDSTIFRDKNSIGAGQDWTKAITAELTRDTAVVALIGPTWATARDDKGHRCLDDPAGWNRIELEQALQRGCRVVPLLVDDAKMPKESELPDSIRAIARANALKLRDDDWDSDIERLAHALGPRDSSSRTRRNAIVAAAVVPIVAAAGTGYWWFGAGEDLGAQAQARWRGWESLGGVLTSSPDASSWSHGRLDIFARGGDSALHHKWYDGNWKEWRRLGGSLASDSAAVSWGPGRIDVFATASDGSLMHKWFEGVWHDWENLGGSLASGPDVSSWGAGRLDVFARGVDTTLMHRWFDGNWSQWESLGGALSSDPAAVSWGPGRIDVVFRGGNGALQHRWFDGGWSNLDDLGGRLVGGPDVSSWGPGRLDAFVRGTNS